MSVVFIAEITAETAVTAGMQHALCDLLLQAYICLNSMLLTTSGLTAPPFSTNFSHSSILLPPSPLTPSPPPPSPPHPLPPSPLVRELGTSLPNPPFLDVIPLVFGLADAQVLFSFSAITTPSPRAARRVFGCDPGAGGVPRAAALLALEL